jgi:hypothetical protein
VHLIGSVEKASKYPNVKIRRIQEQADLKALGLDIEQPAPAARTELTRRYRSAIVLTYQLEARQANSLRINDIVQFSAIRSRSSLKATRISILKSAPVSPPRKRKPLKEVCPLNGGQTARERLTINIWPTIEMNSQHPILVMRYKFSQSAPRAVLTQAWHSLLFDLQRVHSHLQARPSPPKRLQPPRHCQQRKQHQQPTIQPQPHLHLQQSNAAHSQTKPRLLANQSAHYHCLDPLHRASNKFCHGCTITANMRRPAE